MVMAQKKKNAAWADCCEDWGGYMAAKKAKLEEQYQEAAKSEFSEPSSLFNGIAIFVNGYTNPTADELKRLMMAHGGVYHHYLRKNGTTHMIASNLPYTKIVAYRKAQNPLPLCKPEWITDSIKEGKVLDYRKYLLYTQCTKSQPDIFAHVTKQTKKPTETCIQTKPSNSTDTQTKPNNSTASNSNSSNSFHPQTTSTVSSNSTSKKPEIKQTTSNSELPSAIANCTKNPEFLTEFYNNSRLHHIATMGAMFKDYINELRDKNDGKFPGLEALKRQSFPKRCKAGPSTRIDDSDSDDDLFNNNYASIEKSNSPSFGKNQIIMHIDMDCFFVSVGLRNHPELKGFPIAVAHAKGNKQNDHNEIGSMSEIASCSYEARKAGVKNGMFLGQALKLCPDLKTIKYDFEGYKEVSYALYDTVASYTLDIEAVSCDEMYADCTKIIKSSGLTPMEFASVIRNEIRRKTGCPVSTGFGQNKLQARLATKKAKPDGQYYLVGDNVKYFIRTLNVRDLPGVGYSTSHKLHQMDIQTCGDLEGISLYQLQKEFGKKTGQQLHDMCRGIDHNKLNLEHVRKSVSAEVNYGIRFEDNEAANEFLKKLSVEISDRLKNCNSKGKCINLKVLIRAKEESIEPLKFMGCGRCDAFNKSKNLIAPTDDPVIITREVLSLWNQLNQNPKDARGIGIQVTKLESSKTKSNGGTLMKFIENMKVPEKNVDESDSSTNTNLSKESDLEINNVNTENEKSNFQNENEITLSLENQLSEEIDFNCDNESNSQKKNENVQNLNNLEQKEDTANKPEQSSKNSSQLKQKKQQEYFKQTKPFSANKSGKVKLPDIQEIDMKVLIELPEDIRNEILNEYKESNKNQDDVNNGETSEHADANVNNASTSRITNNVEKNLSFSQIDPEFLAALPDEVKNDVKSYCDARKKEKNVPVEEKRPNNIFNKGWNMFKNETKPQKNGTLKSGKLKVTKGGGRKKKENKALSTTSKNTKEEVVPNRTKIQIREENVQNQKIKDSPANRTFHFDPSKGSLEHSEMLSNLVNCLLDLPVLQVKMQIEQWTSNSSEVNDVDFLSLTTFLGTLPRKDRLEDLFVLMKCVHRCMKHTKSCIWHDTYKKMVKHVQTRMLLVYKHRLMIPDEIYCDKCNTDLT